jgi:hypothetical protein
MTSNKSLVPQQNAPITLDVDYLDKAKDWEDFVSLWMISKEIDVRNQWFKGDIANRVVVTYGEGSLRKFAEEVDESLRTIEHYRRVSRAFDVNQRDLNLTWTHYLIASFADSYKKKEQKFDGNERIKWIETAHDNGWSTTRLAAEIKKAGVIADKESVFEYYNDYFDKLRNILMHIEKDTLTDEEKAELVAKLTDVLIEFKNYLKS